MDPTVEYVRLYHQTEVERYVFMMIPRAADAAVVLQDVSLAFRGFGSGFPASKSQR